MSKPDHSPSATSPRHFGSYVEWATQNVGLGSKLTAPQQRALSDLGGYVIELERELDKAKRQNAAPQVPLNGRNSGESSADSAPDLVDTPAEAAPSETFACANPTGCETPNDCREHRCCRSPRSATRASVEVAGVQVQTITIPLETARLVRKACLPINPNKCRGWHPDLLAAARAFIAAVESK